MHVGTVLRGQDGVKDMPGGEDASSARVTAVPESAKDRPASAQVYSLAEWVSQAAGGSPEDAELAALM